MTRQLAVLVLLLLVPFGIAVADEAMWPGTRYDPAIPTQEAVLGYAPGMHVSSVADMQRYMEALAKAAPDRVRITEYARSWEGRRLIHVAIASADKIAGLEDFKAGMKALADSRETDEAEAAALIRDLPGSIWLAYGVHGNEISSMDAAMMTAYHLLAAKDDPVVDGILANTIVFLDPAQNPDGRTRFDSRYYATVGMEPSADRLSVEHNEPWPSGRTNHYLFDMNRDWLAMTQPETIGRIKAHLEYFPLVYVDLHEMSGDSSYYFTPEALPYNPWITEKQRGSLDWIGMNNAKWFDAYGFDYFTREVYDNFYPGYGSSWPGYHGAVTMTYEMASARGERFRRRDGSVLTFRDGVRRHFVTSIATTETVSNRRQDLLRNFYDFRASATAIGLAEKKNRSFIFSGLDDAAGARRLAGLLALQGVEVRKSREGFRACGTTYPAGTYAVDSAQPAGRLIRTIMDRQVDMEPNFLAEQERRRSRNLDDEIYDVTGWSLPLMFNVKTDTCGQAVRVAGDAVAETTHDAGNLINADATIAYLVRWGDMHAVRFLTAALRAGLTVKSADKAFVLAGGASYPAGSLILERATNPADLSATLGRLAATSGATVTGVDTSWVTSGPNFGSENVQTLPAPQIAMLWDAPASALSAGNMRFVIERQFGYPVTAIRGRTLAQADLSHLSVILLPSSRAGYASVLGDAGAKNLKEWVSRGGVLVTIGTGTRWAADPKVDLIGLRREDAVETGEEEKKEKKVRKDKKEKNRKATVSGVRLETAADLHAAIQASTKAPDNLAGVLVNATTDLEHWLTAGVQPNLVALASGRDIYRPLTLDRGRNLISFKGADELLASGYMWEENRIQLAHKPFLAIEERGAGMVIAFTQEPTYRAYLDGLNVIVANALFRAPGHSGRMH